MMSRPRAASTIPSTIRGLDPALYRQARILAVEQGVRVGEIINAALAEYLARYPTRAAMIATQEEAASH
jgi:hypothetical protein